MKKYDGKTGILLQLDAENCKNRNKQLSVTSVIRIPFLFVLLSPLLFFQHKKKEANLGWFHAKGLPTQFS